MLKNYFVVAWRILVKNKMYSAINIAGLAIGFACCITLGMYIHDEWSYDRLHKNKHHIYRVVSKIEQTGGAFNMAVTPGPLAPALQKDFPEIVQTCRIGKQRSALIAVQEKIIEASQALSVDHTFFELFDFKLIRGDRSTALLEPEEAIITETMAAQFFGKDWSLKEDILGSTFILNEKRPVTLAGIIQDPPEHSHLQFDLLLSFQYEVNNNSNGYNWESNNYHTYILLSPGADEAGLNNKLFAYLESKNKYLEGNHLLLQPLLDIYLHSDFAFQTDWTKTGNMVYIRIFFAVGLIVLSIAVFNFINLSTAKAVRRMREVGVRKTIGAGRYQLIVQFFGESLMMSGIAILIAFGLLLIFVPLLNLLSAKSISIPYHFWFFTVLIGFATTCGILAGIYPAVYLSGFKPVKVLKGIYNLKSGRLFRQSLVVAQFSLSLILIIGTLVIYRQLDFLHKKDLGFDQSQLINLKVKNTDGSLLNPMKEEMLKHSGIVSAAANSATLIDVINSTGRVKWQDQAPDDKLMFTTLNVDQDYLVTSGVELIAGRNFDLRMSTDTGKAYIINQTAAAKMGWTPEEALGKSFSLWDHPGQVIGVIKDFHFKSLTDPIDAFVFRFWPTERFQYLLVKLQANRISEAISAIEKVYKKFDPKTTLHYEFLNELVANQYRTQQRSGKVILYFSILTIFISCLGLFGLVTFATEQQFKQIGIRKVLGATVSSIVRLLSADFIKLVLLAILVAVPASVYIMSRWLQTFAYKINLEWWMFMIASSLVLVIAFLTLSYQTVRSAMTNPVKSLRTE
jgi:putative ABC transport system permease protein